MRIGETPPFTIGWILKHESFFLIPEQFITHSVPKVVS